MTLDCPGDLDTRPGLFLWLGGFALCDAFDLVGDVAAVSAGEFADLDLVAVGHPG